MHLRAWLLAFLILVFVSIGGCSKITPVIFSVDGETIEKILDLPDTPAFKNNDDYFDVGIIYKQLTIFFLPIWNYDQRLVGYIGTDQYLPYSHAELTRMVSRAGLTLPEKPQPSIWNQYGGKAVLISIFLAIIFASRRSK